MSKKKIIIIGVVVIGLFLVLLGFKIIGFVSSRSISGSGTIEVTEVQVSSQVMGEIKELFFDEGDKIKKGDILLKVDPRRLRAQYDQAEALEKAARVKFNLAAKEFKRARELFASRMISDQKFDQANSSYKAAGAALQQAAAAKDLAGIMLDNTVITSPLDGVVLSRNIETGELVTVGLPLFTLADLDVVYLKVFIPETQVGKINLGQKAEVSVDSFPGKKFEGSVSYISSRAEFTPKNIQTKKERVNQVFAVKIKLFNPDQNLKPGMPADAKLE